MRAQLGRRQGIGRRHHGAQRLRQDHAAEPARRRRPAHVGTILIDGQDLTQMNERALETHRLQPRRLRLPVLQPDPEHHRVREHRAADGDGGARRKRSAAPGARASCSGWSGLEAKGQKRPEELSGGEQQRVGVALALANDPALILADEPTGNLDSTNASAIANLLKSLATEHGKTVIMVSHDPKTVEVFPTVYAMRDGRFLPAETHAGAGA